MVTRLVIRSNVDVVDANGDIILTWPTPAQGKAWNGSIVLPTQGVNGTWQVTAAGVLFGSYQGVGPYGPLTIIGNEVLTLTGSGLTPGDEFNATFIGFEYSLLEAAQLPCLAVPAYPFSINRAGPCDPCPTALVPTSGDIYAIKTAQDTATTDGTITFNFTAPVGVQAGDLMVYSIVGGKWAGGASTTTTNDPRWTEIYNAAANEWRGLYVKIADQSDEDHTTTYTFTLHNNGSANSSASYLLAAWPQTYGRSIIASDGQQYNPGGGFHPDHSLLFNYPTGADWCLYMGCARSASTFAQGTPNPTVINTPSATLLAHGGTGSTQYRTGVINLYTVEDTDPTIEGRFNDASYSSPRDAAVILGITY